VACSIRNNTGKLAGVLYNGHGKPQDSVAFTAKAKPHLAEPRNRKPVSSKSVEQIETEMLLEELAELIESEGGVLIP
jgi:hypothetical protein